MKTPSFFFFLPKCHKYPFLMLYHHPHLSKERASQLSLLKGCIEEPESRKLGLAGSGVLHSAIARPQAMRGRQESHGALLPLGMSKESLVLLITHPAKCVSARLRAEASNSGNKALPRSMGLLPNPCTRLTLGG